MLHEQRELSGESFEYWIEYLLEFGVEDLIPANDKLTFFQYHNLDLFLIVFGGVYTVLYLVRKIVGYTCYQCCKNVIEDQEPRERARRRKRKRE